MSKKKHEHGYGKIDVDEVYRRVREGGLTDEQRVLYFDRVVLGYGERGAQHVVESMTLRKENLALLDEIERRDRMIAQRDKLIARLEAKVYKLKEDLQRASKRRGSNGHCGPKRHKDKYAAEDLVELGQNSYEALPNGSLLIVGGGDEQPDYEAINNHYAALIEAEEAAKAATWA